MRGGQKGQSGSAESLPPQNTHGQGQGHLNGVEMSLLLQQLQVGVVNVLVGDEVKD